MSTKTLNRTLMITAAAAASALLIAGCNSSSSSGGGGGGGGASNGFASLSQQEKEMLVATMAIDMEDFVTGIGDMGDMALGMAGATSSYQDPRETQSLSIQNQDDQVSSQSWEEVCETGTANIIADSPNHFHAVFNNCSGGFQESGFSSSYSINGTVEARTSDSDTHSFQMMSRADNYAAQGSMSGDGMNFSIGFKMNGQTSQHYSDWNDFVLAANQNVEFDMRCDGSRMQVEINFSDLDVKTVPSTEVSGDAQMELSGSFSMRGNQPGMGGSWTMNTLSPIHFPEFGNPYSGEMTIVVDGDTFNIAYEQSGAWINENFYTWAELEAMDDDFDDDWDFECMF